MDFIFYKRKGAVINIVGDIVDKQVDKLVDKMDERDERDKSDKNNKRTTASGAREPRATNHEASRFA